MADEKFEISETSDGEKFLSKYLGEEKIVEIPQGIIAIGDDAFFKNDIIEEIVIPDGVDYIGNFSFAECLNLKSVSLPSTVQEINISAFEGCVNLEKINLPSKLRIIGSKAFAGCKNLKIEKIPDFLIEVCGDSFDSIETLTQNENFKIENGILYNENSKSLLFAVDKNIESVRILNGTKYLGWNCLSHLKNLKNVSFPYSVSYIGRGAFMFCPSLEKIILMASIKSIDSGAFFNCENLREVIVQGEGLEQICGTAFAGCQKLATITIPAECEVDETAFEKNCLVKHREIQNKKGRK